MHSVFLNASTLCSNAQADWLPRLGSFPLPANLLSGQQSGTGSSGVSAKANQKKKTGVFLDVLLMGCRSRF